MGIPGILVTFKPWHLRFPKEGVETEMKRDPHPSLGTPSSLEVGKKRNLQQRPLSSRASEAGRKLVKKEFQERGDDQLCQLLLGGPGEVWELPTGIGMWRPRLTMGEVERTEI